MAISKMEKATIISAKRNENDLLKVIQEMQNIEVVHSLQDLSVAEKELLADLQVGKETSNQSVRNDLEEQLAAVNESIAFLIEYSVGKATPVFPDNHTLTEFEKIVDKEQIKTIVTAIKELQISRNQLVKDRQKLQAEEDELAKWQYLEVNPTDFADSDYVTSTLGHFSLSVKEKLLTKLSEVSPLLLELPYETQTKTYAYLVYLKDQAEQVEAILTQCSFQRESYEYDMLPATAYQSVKEQLNQVIEKQEALRQEVLLFKEEFSLLQKAEELLLAKEAREEAKERIASYHELIVLRGWIESERKEQFTQVIDRFSSPTNPTILTFEEAQVEQTVPTLLKNNRFVKPFESITEMYSLPKYGEMDPTPFLTPFYLVFFGMMVADVGYGLLMLVATFLAKRFLPLRKNMAGFMDLFQTLSVPVMIWGLIYGSFFGVALPFHLISTTEDMNTILILSVSFGFIQLLVGLLLNGVQLIKKKQYLESISEGFAWQGVLLAIAILVLAKMVLKNDILFNAGIILFIASAILIIIIPMFTSKSKGAGLATGLYNFYGITGYIGDLVSYTRLMALGISGGSIAAAFNMLVGFMPPIARFTIGLLLIILLHALNIFLSLLSAYVHGARLQYVEYFGKFFEGGGQKFSPLKPREKYMDFKIDKEK